MKLISILISIFLVVNATSCGSKKKVSNFSLESDQKSYSLGETITISPKIKNDAPLEGITYTFQGKKYSPDNHIFSEKLDDELLGAHTLYAAVTSEGAVENISIELTILNDKAPKVYSYEIVNTYPHNEDHFTQGLEIHGDFLYESAGKNEESKLLKKELKTGKTLKEQALEDRYFAEGLTIVGNKIHQLSWKSQIGFTYDLNTLKQEGTFAYNQSKEGWGLCHSDDFIYKSDGSTKIWKLNKTTLAEEGFIQITTNKGLKSKFNELEWVNGKIYANTWQKDGIAIINPKNGAIEGIINMKGIRDKVGVSATDNSQVLNGIAYKAATGQLYVTGKYWDSLFEIKVVEKE